MQNYIGSLLSDIAYLDLNTTNFFNGKLTKEGADARGFNEQDRLFFNEYFSVIDQSDTISGTISGFSASTIKSVKSLFVNNEKIINNGDISITYRGTEPNQDFWVDLHMAIESGIELLDGLNYILDKIDLGTANVLELNLVLSQIDKFGSNSFLSILDWQRKNSLYYFNETIKEYPNSEVNIYGHSLGGYLANYVTVMGDNYKNINETITFNAPGFTYQQINVIEIVKKIELLKQSALTSDIQGQLQENLDKLVKMAESSFNLNSLEKLNSIYSTTGPEFTTNDSIGMFHPELRIPLYTDDAGLISNHFVKYLRETLCIYDSLSCLIGGDALNNYNYITKIIEEFTIKKSLTNNFKAIDEILNKMAIFLGISSSTGIDILNHVISLSQSELMTLGVKKTSDFSLSELLSDSGTPLLYSLLNYIPFTITGSNTIMGDIYNPNLYTADLIKARLAMYNNLISNKILDVSSLDTSTIISLRSYQVFYSDKEAIDFVYIDRNNKLIYTNDSDIFKNIENYTHSNTKVTYFNNAESLVVDTLNNVIYDYFGNDNISLKSGQTDLFLSYGADTIYIDLAAGAQLNTLIIEDDGEGDLFIFEGGIDNENIEGTIYKDKIIGNAGIDIISGDDGDDTIYGGTGSDTLNGNNGNDTIYGNSLLTDNNLVSETNDTNIIYGGQGIDTIYGGEGKDIINNVDLSDMSYLNLTSSELAELNLNNGENILFGDRITGGKGDDEIYGTQYGDRYYYNSGDGNDNIYERKSGVGVNEFIDKIYIKSNFSNFSFSHNNTGNLTMTDKTTSQSVVFHDFMNLKYVEKFIFYNNTTESQYEYDAILNIVLNRTAQNIGGVGILNGNDLMDLSHTEKLNGISNITNNINGGYGRDIITGGNLKDIINRSSSNSNLDYSKNYGDDITGGKGDDEIYGTNYGDNYYYNAGDGFDTIYETTAGDTTSENFIDRIVFTGSILSTYISLKQFNSNLIVLYNNIEILQLVDFMKYKGIEQMCFPNGDIWDKYEILGRIPDINQDDPTKINGTEFGETLNGTVGNDTIYGGNGNDIINGNSGDDKIYGDNGNDTLNGGIGNDEIHGGNGNDIINGNEGNDIIYGDAGDDTLTGGTGSDKYHYTLGDGNDVINETSASISDIDILYLHDINPDDVEIYRKGANYSDIYITINVTGEYIIIKNYYQSTGTVKYLEEIIFDNGVTWNSDKIIEQAKHYRGTESNDTINISNNLINVIDSGGGDDIIVNSIKGTTINSGDGSDFINSSGSDAIIKTGNGGDTVIASGNNITIESGSGGDSIRSTMSGTINSGADSDQIDLGSLKETIIYNIGDGKDTIKTTGAGGDIYNITGYNKVNLSNIIISGQGKVLELKFSETDSITLTYYINLLSNINNSMTFNFDDGSMSSNELKDLYTIINKAETADNKFYDTVFSDQITGTNDNENINIINGNGGTGFDTVNAWDGIDTITNKIDNTVINAGNDGDIIYTSGKNVTVYGDAGDDKIYISSTYVGSGYLNGGEGKDTISFLSNSASSNNYVIEGGLGNDTISMSKAIETIIFNKNDGVDTINISGTNADSQSDRLIIRGYSKNIITAENFILYDDGTSVTLKLSENDNIKLVNFLSGKIASNNLKYFEFDDGTLTSQDLIEKISQIKGTAGNDIIYDTAFNDTIDLSNGGDDTVYLRSGNDLLTTSNKSTRINVKSSYNTINSGNGDDTFFVEYDSINTFNLKSSNNGHDTISLGYIGKGSIVYVNISTTINIADTSVSGTGYKFSWGNDSSIYVSTSYVNKQVIFNYGIINYDDINLVGDDGDNYLSAISSKGQTIYGNGGKDTIYGSINDDIIYGGLGNDMLYGKGGDDKIYGEYGDDRIEDLDGNNFISGGVGNDSIYTGGGNDIIYGGEGDDQLNGGGGIDVIYGGDGNDSIYGTGEFYGGNGDDSYHISSGQISDYSGVNSLYFGRHYTAKVDLVSTGNGFNVFINGEHKISYSGNVNRIESKATPPDGYTYKLSLVGAEINKLFEIQAALESETDTSKITAMNTEISNLWKYDQP